MGYLQRFKAKQRQWWRPNRHNITRPSGYLCTVVSNEIDAKGEDVPGSIAKTTLAMLSKTSA